MRERGAEWPIPGPWTYKFFQEALGASYGEILDFYRKVAANKYVTFGPYKAGKTGAYMMDLPAFLAFVALLEILPSVLGASGRPDWKAAVSRTKNMLGQLHVIADKLMVPVIEPLPKPRPEPPIDEPKESPLPAVFQSDEMISPPQPPESVTAKILGQEVNLTELSRKIEPSSEEISPQKLGQLLGVEDERDAVDMAWELVERAGGSRRGGLTEERLSAVVWKVIQKGRK
ncbi:MAG: hypothetical protein HYT21_03340 [Candidatus Nealsonbacteria bacterium]|nr:hypothetical protein [Candidatus Nealsonbacteria bacterium]